MTPMICIVEGDFVQQYWFYKSGKINTVSTFHESSINLKKKLRVLKKLTGSEADHFINSIDVKSMHATTGAMFFGLIGALIGHSVAKKSVKELAVICFRAVLNDNRTFTAVCFEDVFNDIQTVTGISAC